MTLIKAHKRWQYQAIQKTKEQVICRWENHVENAMTLVRNGLRKRETTVPVDQWKTYLTRAIRRGDEGLIHEGNGDPVGKVREESRVLRAVAAGKSQQLCLQRVCRWGSR